MSRWRFAQMDSGVNWRMRLVGIAFGASLALILIRVFCLQLFPESSDLLTHLASRQYQAEITLNPYRGTIYDHRYTPLAISIKTPSVAINPRVFSPGPDKLADLSSLIGVPETKIRQLAARDSYFAWLRRKLPWELAERIRRLEISGVHFLSEHSRYYTGGGSAAHLLGYVGTDNTGLLGLEHSQNKLLQGQPATILSLKDARGEQIFLNSRDITQGRPGRNIVLTIDRVIQEIAEAELKKGMEKSGSQGGFILVGDPHTGRILAMASRPGFNPNKPGSVKLKNTKNLAVSWSFEPGSVMKPFVIAAAIEKKLTTPYEIHNCEKSGRLAVGSRSYIHDDHPREFATTEEVLIHSSNICTFKIAMRLGKKGLYKALSDFGFAGSTSLISVPGKVRGHLSSWKKWRPIRFANISFGQGLLVTGAEIIQAYSVIANGGYLVSPYVVERIEQQNGEVIEEFSPVMRRKVISSETARSLAIILRKVTEEGTATRALLQEYTTAGKTGTAEKTDPATRRYSPDKRIANFAGFAPAESPHVVIYVALDEPSNKPYYGGVWAAPVFREVAKKSLKYLNVAQGRMSTHAANGFEEKPSVLNGRF